jgi:hypothetical protein
MWRPSEPAEEEISDLSGFDPQSKRRRSRRRAWRDGLADQTVVTTLEHVRSYRAFERALVGSVDPRSALELALVHRLASLLWRLRRASAIETGLFEIQGELLAARWQDTSHGHGLPGTPQTPTQTNGHKMVLGSNGRADPLLGNQEPQSTSTCPRLAPRSNSSATAQYFLRLSYVDPMLLDRVGSYKARLWRQAAQTIWTLEAMRRPPPTLSRLRQPVVRSYWTDRRFGRGEPL